MARDGSPVGKKNLSQWYLKITDYAVFLILEGWPNKVKIMQRNWMASRWSEIDFKIKDTDQTLTVFTTMFHLYGAGAGISFSTRNG